MRGIGRDIPAGATMSTTIQTASAAQRGGRSLLRVRGFLGAAAMFISALLIPLASSRCRSRRRSIIS